MPAEILPKSQIGWIRRTSVRVKTCLNDKLLGPASPALGETQFCSRNVLSEPPGGVLA